MYKYIHFGLLISVCTHSQHSMLCVIRRISEQLQYNALGDLGQAGTDCHLHHRCSLHTSTQRGPAGRRLRQPRFNTAGDVI